MDYERTIWIKEEVTNDISCSPGPMLLQDPLKIEEPCFDIKAEPEEELNVGSYDHSCLNQPFVLACSTDSIKEEPELNLTEETENLIEVNRECSNLEYDPLRVKKEKVSVIIAAHWNQKTRIQVIDLIKNRHCCPSEAGERCGVPKVTARRWWREYAATGRTMRLGGSGRPRVSSERDDQRLLNNIRANPFLSCRQLAQISEFSCSDRTVRRRLNDNGIFCQRTAIKQRLTMYQKINRMAFAEEYIDFDWSRVIFSDEKIFSSVNNSPVQVHRPRAAWFTPKYIMERERSGHYSVGVWGYISAQGAGPLWQIEGTLDPETYINILQNIMKPSIELLYPQGDVYFLQIEVNRGFSIPEYDPLRVEKEEIEVNRGFRIPEYDPLRVKEEKIEEYKEYSIPEYDCLRIKKEEGSASENDCLDECDPLSIIDDEEVASKTCPPDSRRFIQTHGDTGSTVFEEKCLLGVTGDNVDIAAEKTALFIGSRTEGQKFLSQEVTALCARDNYNTEKNHLICSSCKQTFSSKYSLIMHVFIHIEGVQPPAHICTLCGEVFVSHDSLRKHSLALTAVHQVNRKKYTLRSTVSSELDSTICQEVCTGKEPPKGDLSNNPFTTTDTPTQQKSCVCGEHSSESDHLERCAVISNERKPQICATDGKYFTCSNRLKKQSLIHAGRIPHKCDVCGKSFKKSGFLRRHLLIHTGEKSYKCSVCGKSFSYSCHLKVHSFIHTGRKPHKCNVCGKSFTQSSGLKTHTVVHTGERAHQCSVCGRSFALSDHLKKHAATHARERIHRCDICGKSFTQSGILKKHTLTHTRERQHRNISMKSFNCYDWFKKRAIIHTAEKPYKCSVCGKSFSQSTSLKEHALIHTSGKVHKCGVCGKSFTQSLRLKVHLLVHTAEGPHKCDLCGKSFTQAGDLQKHALIHIDESLD